MNTNLYKKQDKINLIQKSINEDRELQALYAERVKIYTFSTPIAYLKNGKVVIEWLDETNNERLKKVDELIKLRTEQIVNYYSR